MRRWQMVTSRILFTAKQKDELWGRWKNGQSVLAISRALERRNKTGVQRIVALNGGIAPAPRRRAVAAQKLALQWSPEQISGWLKQQFPTDRDMRISHEAIYRSLFVQARGVLKKELTAQLRTRRQMRHAKGVKAKNGQGHILDMVSIRERPAEAEDRAVPGHWEGDLLTGASD